MRSLSNFLFCFITVLTAELIPCAARAQDYVSFKDEKKSFMLASNGKPVSVFISDNDHKGVVRAAKDLCEDIGMVAGTKAILSQTAPSGDDVIIIGTIGQSQMIDKLIADRKINVIDVQNKWETFLIQTVTNPLPGVKRALVITGSDKRGTIFGIYDLSKQIGISPWYWWADVVPVQNKNIAVRPGRYVQGEPSVKYRGIFINDEEPALGRWAVEKYGGFNHVFYEKVFELILRMKGNYLWPAMWWASFNSDDVLNPELAEEYGIVMSTTHHEPMMRAHKEWKKFAGESAWNYEVNPEKLRQFWTDGIRRMGTHESIVSMGMRGDGDMAMTEDTNIALLEKIVADQRKIISDVTGKPASETPQLWALYKEVQDYYDKGMRVPDDVTLLLCDDNWGNIRKLPKIADPKRSGGYGIYYHFDYVGDPRNYKWMNTNQISRVWEQMHLAKEYGADRIWIVNVGDIKPVELPTEFFLDYAWNATKWDNTNIDQYSAKWAAKQFGNLYAKKIGDILTTYTTYNSRRKPELLSADTYSLSDFNEAQIVVDDYNRLAADASKINDLLPSQYKDAYYQLVLYPVTASATLNELWFTVAKNRLYAKQGRASTNDIAKQAKDLFVKDSLISRYYNKTLSGGKWNHMADQTHISYTYWQQPEKDKLPEVKTITLNSSPDMRVAVEGSDAWWPQETADATLPEFDNLTSPSHYVDIYNGGNSPFDYSINSSHSWVKLSNSKGKTDRETRIVVSIDWKQIPDGVSTATITVTGANKTIPVKVTARKQNAPDGEATYVEANGYVSIEAAHYSKAITSENIKWMTIPDFGKTLSGVTTYPVTALSQKIGKNTPHLEYKVNLYDTGSMNVHAYLSPTLNFHNTQGLRYAISFDDDEPKIINMHEENFNKAWGKWVSDNINIKTSEHTINKAGNHTVKFWMVDPGIVLQKIVIENGTQKSTYLGPPESYRTKSSAKSVNKK